jgi:3-phenylpropionate/trans-cinnamate dioxygenase ferredoxin reductase subunit
MMRQICKVVVNGEEFSANCGDLLLDAALMNGVDIPHDCRSGYCGTCRVNVVSGRVFGGQDGSPNMAHARGGQHRDAASRRLPSGPAL